MLDEAEKEPSGSSLEIFRSLFWSITFLFLASYNPAKSKQELLQYRRMFIFEFCQSLKQLFALVHHL